MQLALRPDYANRVAARTSSNRCPIGYLPSPRTSQQSRHTRRVSEKADRPKTRPPVITSSINPLIERSCLPTRLQDLLQIHAAVIIRRLKVIEFLLQICDLGFLFAVFGREALVHGIHRHTYEPTDRKRVSNATRSPTQTSPDSNPIRTFKKSKPTFCPPHHKPSCH